MAADSSRRPAKSVILLWMNGGPSTIDLWDLKPGHENGGEFREIETAAPGLKISEYLPKLAARGKDLAVVRSVASKEGDHGRGTLFVKTGYAPTGPIQFPHVGAAMSRELMSDSLDLPGFVSIAPGRSAIVGGGFLGPKFAPLSIGERAAGPSELTVPDLERAEGVTAEALADRVRLLNGLEQKFALQRQVPIVNALQTCTAKAIRLMKPEAAATFHLEQEADALRDAYGRTLFGQGCLLARRLVERGVPFVEVTLSGWDTHNNNFQQVKDLSGILDTKRGPRSWQLVWPMRRIRVPHYPVRRNWWLGETALLRSPGVRHSIRKNKHLRSRAMRRVARIGTRQDFTWQCGWIRGRCRRN
jgi:hypothetical protein